MTLLDWYLVLQRYSMHQFITSSHDQVISVFEDLPIDTSFDRLSSENPKKVSSEACHPVSFNCTFMTNFMASFTITWVIGKFKSKSNFLSSWPSTLQKEGQLFFFFFFGCRKSRFDLLTQRNVPFKDINLMIKTYFNFFLQVCFSLMIRWKYSS